MLVSGGLDSCVAAAVARRDGFELAFLHGNYGHLTQTREMAAFASLADAYGVPSDRRLVVELPHLGAIGGSSLTDRSMVVERSPLAHGVPARARAREGDGFGAPGSRSAEAQDRSTRPGSQPAAAAGRNEARGAGREEIPSSYVPFRNAHFLRAAAAWAEVLGAQAIVIGAVEEDSSGYPDCRGAFFEAFERAIDLGTRPETHIVIRAPLLHLDKGAIVRLGLELGAPLHLTWSCYSQEERACGVCDSCALRLRGFLRAGAKDPIAYAS